MPKYYSTYSEFWKLRVRTECYAILNPHIHLPTTKHVREGITALVSFQNRKLHC